MRCLMARWNGWEETNGRDGVRKKQTNEMCSFFILCAFFTHSHLSASLWDREQRSDKGAAALYFLHSTRFAHLEIIVFFAALYRGRPVLCGWVSNESESVGEKEINDDGKPFTCNKYPQARSEGGWPLQLGSLFSFLFLCLYVCGVSPDQTDRPSR